MHIAQSDLNLTSRHELHTERVTQWLPTEAPRAAQSFERLLERQIAAIPSPLLRTDDAAKTQAASAETTDRPLRTILEMLFGLPHAPTSLPQVDTGPSAPERSLAALGGWRLERTTETESCDFAAHGNICLADGSNRQIDVDYRMQRHTETTSLSASFHDPLVVDLTPNGGGLDRQQVAFDIDGDGKMENLRLPENGSAVLFYDRNRNGIADDGSELFGPRTGNGFGELAQLDSDGNGWIDAGDAAFADLKLWRLDKDGAAAVESLAAAGIGALSTHNVDTPFAIKDQGAAVGQVRASGVWIGEREGAGTVRQIDIAADREPVS